MAGTLYRSSTDKILGGVCGGIAKYLNVDVTIVRIITALAVVFTGFGPILYLLLWAILPEQSTGVRGIDMMKDEATKLKGQYDQKRQAKQEQPVHNPHDLR